MVGQSSIIQDAGTAGSQLASLNREAGANELLRQGELESSAASPLSEELEIEDLAAGDDLLDEVQLAKTRTKKRV